jgi:hypothetical protein
LRRLATLDSGLPAINPRKGLIVVPGILILSTLFAAEPAASALKPADNAKVYVVYVTVVEVDADGNELILFMPKVQTTGNPAGVTVEHVDGRAFEFNCKMTMDGGPALQRTPRDAVNTPVAHKASKSALKKESPVPVPPALAPAPVAQPAAETVAKAETMPVPPAAPRQPEEFSIRTYDVSDLIATEDRLDEVGFAPLIQTLKSVVLPESWAGPATIRPFPSTKSLVIKQNGAGHRAIAEALNGLRPQIIETQPTEK